MLMGITTDPHASYKMLARELTSRGYEVIEHTEDGKLSVTFTSPKGQSWTTKAAHLSYPFTMSIVNDLSTDKSRATIFASENGVNTPPTMSVEAQNIDEERLRDFLALHKKLVVKPLDRSLSLGLTTDITDIDHLKKAIGKASQYSAAVLVQAQVFGEEVRLALLNGKAVAALLRRTPQVVGDGTSTVQQLIDEENKSREKIKDSLVEYPLLDNSLIRKSVDRHLVPLPGEVIELSRATMISKGCSVYDIFENIDESYIRIAERLVQKLGTGFIVVDIFVQSFTQPANESNYWFIEFNTSPVLKLFYSCRDGNMHNIVPPLANAIDRRIHTSLTVGSFEQAAFPELGNFKVIAKVDTGAYSGAIGCSKIKIVRRDGERVLRFTPGVKGKESFETKNFRTRLVRSSSGHNNRRHIIDTVIKIGGKNFPITIGLSKRGDMKYEVLLGRRFLREQNMLVDVRINQEYDTGMEMS